MITQKSLKRMEPTSNENTKKEGSFMEYSFKVPQDKKIDVIIDSDAKNEADDQYAITHALLSPKLNILGIVAAHFGTKRTNNSMEESYKECEKILSIMNIKSTKAYRGNKTSITSRENYEVSEGVDFIIEQAHKAKECVNIAVIGPLTNIAAALLKDPSIKDKIRVIWSGGTFNDIKKSGFEANARNDYLAVNIVMENCTRIVQIPFEIYSKAQVSMTELEQKVKPCGEIGAYLFEQLIEFNYVVNRPWLQGESWGFGDTGVISFLINKNSVALMKRNRFLLDSSLEATEIDKEIDVVCDLNYRFALEDFFSKLYLYSQSKS